MPMPASDLSPSIPKHGKPHPAIKVIQSTRLFHRMISSDWPDIRLVGYRKNKTLILLQPDSDGEDIPHRDPVVSCPHTLKI